MNVLVLIRADWLSKPGGDSVQVRHTVAALQKLGASVAVCATPAQLRAVHQAPDVVHGFNLDRPGEMLALLHAARRRWPGVPFAISTIHHKDAHIADVLGASTHPRDRLIRWLSGLGLRRLLAAARVLLRRADAGLAQRLRLAWQALMTGEQQQKKAILDETAAIVVLARAEQEWLQADLGVDVRARSHVVPNGFAPQRFAGGTRTERPGDLIMVGRIEPRKNPLALLRAARAARLSITFVGAPNPNFGGYARAFERELRKYAGARWIQGVAHEAVPDLLRAHKVHVLPSLAEVLPLVDFEALACGCFVLTTDRSGSAEYLRAAAGGWATFCPSVAAGPRFPDLLRNSVARGDRADPLVLHLPSWLDVAARLFAIYRELARPARLAA
jgi:glycosyltransferase involved in cell wall biosynthesis